ncbi:hypothetical protein ABZY90_00830 [Streptomyces sp. NPDC006422]|uniref:hypothetical protein n=1 Tax=unclassified Streptomyces TaxID=2593676 RepID=UPI00339E7662
MPRLDTAAPVRALLAAVLTLLGWGALPAPAAHAADPQGLSAPASFRVAPYGGKPRPDREKRILISYDRGVPRGTAHGSTLTMDVTDSSDVLRLKQYGNGCSGTDRKVVCRVGEAYDSWTDWAGALPRAAPGSKPGDEGELRVSFRTSEGELSRATPRVVVGGPVLALREQDTLRVGSGARTDVALGVRNTGELPADGFAVTTTVDDGLRPVHRSRSCTYLPHGGATTVTCRFPKTALRPGEEVYVKDWLRLDASETLMDSSFRTTVTLVGRGAENGGLDGSSRSTKDPTPPGTPRAGTGPALVPQVGTARAGSGKYSEDKDVWTKVRIANRPDYAVTSQLSTADGDSRRLRVGARNDGSGDPGGGLGGVSLTVTLPPGTDVRKEPMEEIDDDVFEPLCRHRGLTYTCPLSPPGPHESSTVDFEVRESGDGVTDKARAALKVADTSRDHADEDTTNNTRTFALFGADAHLVAADTESGPGTGVVVAWVCAGAAVLAGATLLVRRRVRGHR